MRTVLRALIALNWLAFAVACNGYFGHRMVWGHVCFDLARDDLARDRPDLVPYSEEYHKHDHPRAAEYRRRTEPIAKYGDWGWLILAGVTITTAVGLMAVFPKKSESPTI